MIRLYGQSFLARHRVSDARKRVLRRLRACRTEEMGAHVRSCEECHWSEIAYNSCRDRHCPKCQAGARADWLDARRADLLPVEYFHVVFTLPREVAEIALQNKAVLYKILFDASAETLTTIAADPRRLGARLGFVSILHTWTQTLIHHPHIHCVVPGGGLALDGPGWVSCPRGFFLPVRVLSKVFRGKFLGHLRAAYARGELHFQGGLTPLSRPAKFAGLLHVVEKKPWVVYSKPPFGGPEQVLKYLARYTHRVAISNHRIRSIQDGRVTFTWKDRAKGNRPRTMTLAGEEFLRRFTLHVLPKGFVRIRHYGFLGNRSRKTKIPEIRTLLDSDSEATEPSSPQATAVRTPHRCPVCGAAQFRYHPLTEARAPPTRTAA